MKMSEAAKAARNKYAREWYKKNKERVKKRQAEHWERKAREELEKEGTPKGDANVSESENEIEANMEC